MSNRILRLSAAAAMIFATPALASAQTIAYGASSPVSITTFSVDESYVSGGMGGDVIEAPRFVADAVTVKFVNKSDVPATTVKFLLKNGQYTQTIVDKGLFSPGVQIEHGFPFDSSMDTLSNATCNVAEVDFADGSTWHMIPGVAENR